MGKRIFQVLQPLNFPKFPFRFKNSENKISIFDVIRKRFVILQPEEWVRQHCVHYLMNEKKYPISHINVEKELLINGLTKRYDIGVCNNDGRCLHIVECEAPSFRISQNSLAQVARYNLSIYATYLMVTNALHH